MDKFKKIKNSKFVIGCVTFGAIATIAHFSFGLTIGQFGSRVVAAEVKENQINSPQISFELKAGLERLFKIPNEEWPTEFSVGKKKYKIEYSFNTQLDSQIRKLLKMYRSDFSTVTVIDNETGEVLAAVGFEGKSSKFDSSLILTATHPSASLIKIVTAAELIQNSKITKETPFEFKGRSTTLFKYQLNESKSNRWDKVQTFETAFAKSNNVIFGKAAIQNLSSQKLVHMAESFGFNESIMNEFDFLKSQIRNVDDDYKLAELASGFNDQTVISPIHAASIASVVANNGNLKKPMMITRIIDSSSKEVVWKNSLIEKSILTAETNNEMKQMMEMTIDGGTARKSFRKMNNGYKNALDIGGKTGSITGGKPFGKRDWFAAYAIPKDVERGHGISISVMNVNVKKWHVKSTMLAKNIIEYYYNNVRPVPITMVKMPSVLSARQIKNKSYSRKIASIKNNKKKVILKKQIGKRNERRSSARI